MKSSILFNESHGKESYKTIIKYLNDKIKQNNKESIS